MKNLKIIVVALALTIIVLIVWIVKLSNSQNYLDSQPEPLDNQPEVYPAPEPSEPAKPTTAPAKPLTPASFPKKSGSLYPGDKITFTWNFSDAPANAAVMVYISGPSGGRIIEDAAPSGSYTWTVPPYECSADGMSCIGVTDSAMYNYSVPGNYEATAELYTPKGGLGGGMLPSSKDLKKIASYKISSFVIAR